jgi:hypothetical protein
VHDRLKHAGYAGLYVKSSGRRRHQILDDFRPPKMTFTTRESTYQLHESKKQDLERYPAINQRHANIHSHEVEFCDVR